MILERSLERHFSRAASQYELEAEIQRSISRQLANFLASSERVHSILELGTGTGFLTQELLQRFPQAELDAVDISAPMLEVAKFKLAPYATRCHFHQADLRRFVARRNYDLIASSSTFQWIADLGDLASRLQVMLHPNGRLLFSTMVAGTLGELHQLRAELFPDKLPRLPFATSAQVLEHFSYGGFEVLQSSTFEHVLHLPTAWDLLRYLRRLGFAGGELSTGNKLLTRSQLILLCREYEERYRQRDSVPAGFSVLFVLAQKRQTQ